MQTNNLEIESLTTGSPLLKIENNSFLINRALIPSMISLTFVEMYLCSKDIWGSVFTLEIEAVATSLVACIFYGVWLFLNLDNSSKLFQKVSPYICFGLMMKTLTSALVIIAISLRGQSAEEANILAHQGENDGSHDLMENIFLITEFVFGLITGTISFHILQKLKQIQKMYYSILNLSDLTIFCSGVWLFIQNQANQRFVDYAFIEEIYSQGLMDTINILGVLISLFGLASFLFRTNDIQKGHALKDVSGCLLWIVFIIVAYTSYEKCNKIAELFDKNHSAENNGALISLIDESVLESYGCTKYLQSNDCNEELSYPMWESDSNTSGCINLECNGILGHIFTLDLFKNSDFLLFSTATLAMSLVLNLLYRTSSKFKPLKMDKKILSSWLIIFCGAVVLSVCLQYTSPYNLIYTKDNQTVDSRDPFLNSLPLRKIVFASNIHFSEGAQDAIHSIVLTNVYKYVIVRLEPSADEYFLTETASQGTYEEFVDKLSKLDHAVAFYRLQVETSAKVIKIIWVPEQSSENIKQIYRSSWNNDGKIDTSSPWWPYLAKTKDDLNLENMLFEVKDFFRVFSEASESLDIPKINGSSFKKSDRVVGSISFNSSLGVSSTIETNIKDFFNLKYKYIALKLNQQSVYIDETKPITGTYFDFVNYMNYIRPTQYRLVMYNAQYESKIRQVLIVWRPKNIPGSESDSIKSIIQSFVDVPIPVVYAHDVYQIDLTFFSSNLVYHKFSIICI